jgi:hypothetical protein
MIPELRPYQHDVLTAVMDSVIRQRGLTFSVEIARQGGKNELSARLELMLLYQRSYASENLIKCSPTFVPQAIISMTRLKDRLDDAGYTGLWLTENGYIIRFGNARTIFLSAEESSRVVGHTAHLLLEIDEAQDVGKEKYSKEFRPMASTTNATTILYGTAWDDSTLLEETKQTNLELERKDGLRRHFQFDWQEVARYNPGYQAYVESERQRLGDNHPLFLTQYCLQPIRGGDGFLSAAQRAQLQGSHPRRRCPEPGKVYIAGIDLAGEAEQLEGEQLIALNPRQDSTVVTIAELDLSGDVSPFTKEPAPGLNSGGISPFHKGGLRGILPASSPLAHACPSAEGWERVRVRGPSIRVVEHYRWAGRRHTDLYPQLVDLLKNVWHCRRVVVDATGIGQPVASFLRESLGKAVVPFTFTAPAKSELGFNLLAAINLALSRCMPWMDHPAQPQITASSGIRWKKRNLTTAPARP